MPIIAYRAVLFTYTEMFGPNAEREKHFILDVTFGEWREMPDRHIDGRTHKCFSALQKETYGLRGTIIKNLENWNNGRE